MSLDQYDRICVLVGAAAAEDLCAAYGGTRVVFSEEKMAGVLFPEAVKTLRLRHGSEAVYIPVARVERAKRLFRLGHTTVAVAERLGITVRRAQQIRLSVGAD